MISKNNVIGRKMCVSILYTTSVWNIFMRFRKIAKSD